MLNRECYLKDKEMNHQKYPFMERMKCVGLMYMISSYLQLIDQIIRLARSYSKNLSRPSEALHDLLFPCVLSPIILLSHTVSPSHSGLHAVSQTLQGRYCFRMFATTLPLALSPYHPEEFA